MNNKWNYRPASQEQTEAAKALAKETGINPVLCKLLLEEVSLLQQRPNDSSAHSSANCMTHS